MAVKKLNPVTPGTRHRIAPDFSDITASKPEKSLTEAIRKTGGRNNEGHRTARYIGGGHKRKYRIIDFKRDKKDIEAEVMTIEYDPNRTSRIALVKYTDGEKRYIIAPQGLRVGLKIVSGEKVAPEVGNALLLKNMPLGTIVHNIELTPGKGGQMARSAGTYAQVLAKDGKFVTLKMPSGEMRMVLGACIATVGSVSNPDHMNVVLGKAGRKRWLGVTPRVRGVAMNPVDHPMGGGEGRASGGHPRSRNGLIAKGKKTRSKNKYSNRLIISRRTK
ncbi:MULTISPECIES: 50S ribosomal protein L2 [unclassified Lacihabitans]|jgi:large subunit ribosomal protein L2|uniref:50S ribosomal protein L2 n=1 Tax=unclassified Lacihabitans TaxID=2638817 RepID=UPI000BC40846|nr:MULTISPECIES: 50S ribosomal protein L2 [unclassified Lacihabitans]MBP6460517.1 50S ribosomal protein L2 [Crocinitomicaceae bacterium]MBP6619138.1 50S ribosomal protein L2 [Leadbetterella sp.]OYU64636.1 MAG: 50S ribosomal protein L2 [Cytophagaceae bacterium BCCC1]MCP9746313.1 50S ribosomal protein L2 [Lacihabitans sp. CS3-21]MCP9755856.1 50S ribosomal protein L2 [Lacihabitans sp. CCS-44]